ncbi:MAG: hypothetical protein COT43_05390 [Candidatus Marinimicrobia bacterium CG08_land_8_20_14_0_20_45_22]|nr:MAG: hypothetical protein COT43_05390 [Candidatus Marinimicrobia bacterium CG08_land_8_20_14_0_20_45_22]
MNLQVRTCPQVRRTFYEIHRWIIVDNSGNFLVLNKEFEQNDRVNSAEPGIKMLGRFLRSE